MEAKGKLTKDVIAREARFVLDSVLNSGIYPNEVPIEDLRQRCEPSVSLRLLDYINFLERFGYLTYDRANHGINITGDGERVITGEKAPELVVDVVHHFRSILVRPRAKEESVLPRRTSRAGGVRETLVDQRYEKIRTIGSGGIGTVHLARQLTLDRQVALKEIRELFGFFTEPQRQEIARRFDEESRKSARLSHPNIAKVLDGNTTCDFPYLVSEYVASGNLRRVLDQAETIPPELSVKVFLQVLHGLGHAHSMGVIHRGLKPENVLFDGNGNVRLTDFGMARVVERDQAVIKHVYVGLGSVAYLAPELFNDPTGVDPRSDLYSVGIVFYEMLARKLPGRRSPMPTKLHSNLPPMIDNLFDKLTQDDPDARYQTVDEVLEDFYKTDASKNFLEPRGAVLFLTNPLDKLGLKPLEPEQALTNQGQDPAAPAEADVPGQAAASPAESTAVTTAEQLEGEGDGEPGDDSPSGRRSRKNRPYSFQRRITEREK